MGEHGEESGRRGAEHDTSTDSIELTPVQDGALTQTYESASREALGLGLGRGEFEANVILIAHPEHKALGSRYRLGPGAVIEIGRSPAAEISLPDVLSVSRNHARLEHRGSRVLVEDLGSTNGTYVNDQQIRGATVLHSGDRFQVGAVHFKFLHERDVEHAYHEAIHELVMRDGLTEIFNKRKYEEEISREFARAKRYDRPLSLILIDLDNFKLVNDNYGHLCGDFVLKQVARRVRDTVRAEQIFARVGGEEFAVLCPETEVGGAEVLAEKLRRTIGEHSLEYAGFELGVTCSFGVAQVESFMKGPADLYEAADRALYQSKKAGRDRVTVFSEKLCGPFDLAQP